MDLMNSLISKQSMNHQERKEMLKSFLLIFMELLHWMPPNTSKDSHGVQHRFCNQLQGGRRYDSKLQKKVSASKESIHELRQTIKRLGYNMWVVMFCKTCTRNIVKLTLLKANKPWPSLGLENWTAWTSTHGNKNWFPAWVERDCGQLHCQLLRSF